MAQGVSNLSFSNGSSQSIDTWLFSSLSKTCKLKKPTCDRRESFGIFLSRPVQPRVKNQPASCYFETL